MTYEYAVCWQEGSIKDFNEWSCGCPRIYGSFADAEEVAQEMRDDELNGYMTNIEVVWRLKPIWETCDATTAYIT